MALPGEQLVIKLWDSLIDKGMGSLLKPWQLRREGQAMIDVRKAELLQMAQIERDILAIKKGEKVLLSNGEVVPAVAKEGADSQLTIGFVSNKSVQVIKAEEIRKEISVNKAILYAEDELLKENQKPSDRPINEDWLLRWRDGASSISSDELLGLWGRVLAGEVKDPGAYSLRTLEFLKHLSQEEAGLIESVMPFVFDGFIYRGDEKILEAKGITFQNLLSLQELGILSGVDSFGLERNWKSIFTDRFEVALVSSKKLILVKNLDPAKSFSIQPLCLLTIVGIQLYRLIQISPNEDIIHSIVEKIKSQGFKAQVGDIDGISNGQITYRNLIDC